MTDSIIKELLFTVDFRNKRKYKEKRLRIGRLKGNYLRVFAKSFYNPDRLKNKTRFFFFFYPRCVVVVFVVELLSSWLLLLLLKGH